MLGKLIKNEFKATARNFIPIYLLLLLVTLGVKALELVQDYAGKSLEDNIVMNVIGVVLIITFVLAIMAIIFGTVILIAKRFYENMLKDEGYLSFTLPVTTGQHIISKVFVSYIWIIASALVCIMSFIIFMIGEPGAFKEIGDTISQMIQLVNKNGWWGYVIQVVLVMIIGIYNGIMLLYTCFSVGQIYNKHRIAGAFITGICIYVISQIVNSIFLISLIGANINTEVSMESGLFQPVMLYALIEAVVEAVLYTSVTYIMLRKKLNLE